MSSQYIQTEIAKLLNNKKAPLDYAMASAWIIAHFKGVNLKIYDTQNSSSLCDYNLIASAENTIQAKSMVNEIVKSLKEAGADVLSLEGLADGEWILLDIGDIIIHIFQDTSRGVFDLDDLWKEAPQVEIPNEFYFGESEEANPTKVSAENYF